MPASKVIPIALLLAGKQLYMDRHRPGKSAFKPGFASHSAGALELRNGRVKLPLFVDRSSVEAFGSEGEAVLSELIFPRPESQGLQV